MIRGVTRGSCCKGTTIAASKVQLVSKIKVLNLSYSKKTCTSVLFIFKHTYTYICSYDFFFEQKRKFISPLRNVIVENMITNQNLSFCKAL